MRSPKTNSEMDVPSWAWEQALKQTERSAAQQGRYKTPFSSYLDDPVRFGKEVLGHRYWAGQEAIMNAVVKHKRVAVRSCRKSGKSYCAADLALAFACTGPCVVIVTAPGERQVREVLFAKIAQSHAQARQRLPGAMGVQSLRIDHNWLILGVAASDPANILGFHAEIVMPEEGQEVQSVIDMMKAATGKDKPGRLFVIFDEAIGVEQSIFDALEGSLSGENFYSLMLANPRMSEDSGHSYANSFRQGSGWFRIHLGAEEPTAETVGSDLCFHKIPENLVTKEWIEERRAHWGENSMLFQADVLGCFASDATDRQMIPLHVLEGADKWQLKDDLRATSRHIGCDLAGGETAGQDYCVATLWINGALSGVHKWRSPSTMESIGILSGLRERWSPEGSEKIPWSHVHMDATGVGKGAVDRMREQGLFVDGVNFGARPRYEWRSITGDMKFRDRKTELYWALRRALQEGHAQIPRKYQEVWRELQWHTHTTIARGGDTALALAESKDKLRDKYGRSPDSADSAVLAWSRSGMRPTFRVLGWR